MMMNNYEELIRKQAKKLKLDPDLMCRVAKAESALNPKAISPVGAKGIFQLMDITVRQIANLGFKIRNPFNAAQNITGGIIYFRWLFDMYKGDAQRLEKTLAAWNWGQNNFAKDKPLILASLPQETQNFIKRCLTKNSY
jgi:soluble lytic murein transglycosylase-like protein